MMSTLRPALVSSGLALGLDYMLGKNTYDWKQTATDVAAMGVATLSSQVIKDAIPNFGVGSYGRLIDKFNFYALQPILSAIIYSYIYNMAMRGKYEFAPSTKWNGMNLYFVGGITTLAANVVSDNLLCWLM